jgi:predicted kinase
VKSVVLVNGIPGSGKSTLCAALGPSLGFPVFAKDAIKETLFDTLGVADRAWSMKLGLASAKVIWALVWSSHGPVLIDSNIAPSTRKYFLEDASAAGVERIIEVWCDIATEVAFARYAARVGAGRHPGHCDNVLALAGAQRWAPQNEPAGFGPLLRVPTDSVVDIPAVAAWVRQQLAEPVDLSAG